jgi:protein-disulfide isomerase
MEISATLTHPVSADDHAEGPADAPLALVEYGDYQCPYCGAAYPVVKRLQKALGRKLRFVFRNFPLTQAHPDALIAALAAEAAALQGKFWEMHDLLYEQQASLTADIIPRWAEKIGLNLDIFGNHIKQGIVEKRIQADRQSGIRSGVNGTPTFLSTEHVTTAHPTMSLCWRHWSLNWRYTQSKDKLVIRVSTCVSLQQASKQAWGGRYRSG